MFVGMFGVVGLSLTLKDAFTPAGDSWFIAFYIAVRIVLLALYARAAWHVPLARAYCMQYVIGLSVSSLMLAASLLLPPPARYIVWAGSLIVEFAIPFLNLRATRMIPIDRSHIPERLGLFTILVLGEAVIATATGAASAERTLATFATAAAGFAIAAAIWWINFDFVEDNAIRSNSLFRRFVYLYSHFFMVASIVAIGVGIEHAIIESYDYYLHMPSIALAAGGIAVFLTVTTIVRLVTGVRKMAYVRVVSIVLSLIVLAVGQYLPPTAVVAALFLILCSNIWAESRFSSEHSAEEEFEPHLVPCEHEADMVVHEPRKNVGCEECHKNNYKWVHLRLCRTCGHTGCCDSSAYKHASKHFAETGHPIISSQEAGENWAWCYVDERFVPDSQNHLR
jgi:low temperature requirement protein LtrA